VILERFHTKLVGNFLGCLQVDIGYPYQLYTFQFLANFGFRGAKSATTHHASANHTAHLFSLSSAERAQDGLLSGFTSHSG